MKALDGFSSDVFSSERLWMVHLLQCLLMCLKGSWFLLAKHGFWDRSDGTYMLI